ncbi:unnamed protein product [Symbiodinium natans]|uniref:Uncharacterized protein n=1 Tax=Symbiodinium natans TaxID=878477 RepID=A0A812Q6W7_9DINO|nr:unnamed protein product [Symbiodinium natans]
MATPARQPLCSSTRICEETPEKVTRATKCPKQTDSKKRAKDSEQPDEELKLPEPEASGKGAGAKKCDEVLKLTIQEGPEGPTFQMDGQSYLVTDVAALLELGTVVTSSSTKRSLASFRRHRAQGKKPEDADGHMVE